MKNRSYVVYIALIVGIVSFLLPLSIDGLFSEWSKEIGSLKYVIVGIGAGLAGASASKLLTNRMYEKNPELAKKARINENDERYIIIRKTAAYYMWYITLFLLCAMSLLFVILDFKIATLVTLAVMVCHIILFFILIYKISNKI